MRRGERPEPAEHEGVAGAGDEQRAALAAPGVQHLAGHDKDHGVPAHRLCEAARPARWERDGREERLGATEWAAGDELQQRPQPALDGLRVRRRCRHCRHGAEPGGEQQPLEGRGLIVVVDAAVRDEPRDRQRAEQPGGRGRKEGLGGNPGAVQGRQRRGAEAQIERFRRRLRPPPTRHPRLHRRPVQQGPQEPGAERGGRAGNLGVAGDLARPSLSGQ